MMRILPAVQHSPAKRVTVGEDVTGAVTEATRVIVIGGENLPDLKAVILTFIVDIFFLRD